MAKTWIPEAIHAETDRQSGAVVEQLTSEPVTSTNIYCEQRYASADGGRIAIERRPFGRPSELWVCDLDSLRLCRIGEAWVKGANAHRSAIYYADGAEAGARLMRLNLDEMTVDELWCFDGMVPPRSSAVSPDERWFVGGPFPVQDNVHRLARVDLHTGHRDVLCDLAEMTNPHVQFNPADPRCLLVQINREGAFQLTHNGVASPGRLGATLCVVDVPSGEVTPLPIGRPHTPPMSGHECWVGASGRLLFTAGRYRVSRSAHVTLRETPADQERDMPAAAIYDIAPGEAQPRVAAEGLLFNHVAASDDGRFFIADDHATGRLHVGSVASGASLPLCNSHTRQGTCQHSHAHAYMTPDNQHVVFNSIVTGVAQVYAARMPEGFLEQVMRA